VVSMEAQSHILVVDDQAAELGLLREMLSRMSDECQVDTALSAEEALEKVRARHYDLILTDLGMPDVSGIALTKAVREKDPQTVVVWITAYGCWQFRKEAERLEVYSCLDKPAGMARIRKTVRQALHSRR
jgi:DNA-binding NtrC family response regulator